MLIVLHAAICYASVHRFFSHFEYGIGLLFDRDQYNAITFFLDIDLICSLQHILGNEDAFLTNGCFHGRSP